MRRVCFWADLYWAEGIHEQLYETITEICSADDHVEFWMYACNDYLTEDAVRIISELKNTFRCKSAKTISPNPIFLLLGAFCPILSTR